MMQQILLYFGSFNPVHCGHIAVADHALQATGADALWMVVSPCNPFKKQEELAPLSDRLAMTELALKNARHSGRISVCGIEQKLPKPSRTILTLETLSGLHPDTRFSLLMGSDNVEDFGKWMRYEDILARYPVWVYPRPGYPPPQDPGNVPWISRMHLLDEVPLFTQAATSIRNRMTTMQHPQEHLFPEVWNYIKTHRLYGSK